MNWSVAAREQRGHADRAGTPLQAHADTLKLVMHDGQC
jgi:hypothetical protein